MDCPSNYAVASVVSSYAFSSSRSGELSDCNTISNSSLPPLNSFPGEDSDSECFCQVESERLQEQLAASNQNFLYFKRNETRFNQKILAVRNLGLLILTEKFKKGGEAAIWMGKEYNTTRLYAVSIQNFPDDRIHRLEQSMSIKAKVGNQPGFVPDLGTFVRPVKNGHHKYYRVMPYYPRGDLSGFSCSLNRTFKFTESARIARQILKSVKELHQSGICHRDIKPENFLVDTSGPEISVLMGDFGFARPLDDPRSMRSLCGTLRYMAPELLRKTSWALENKSNQGALPPLTEKVDMWAVGMIVHWLFFHRMPLWYEVLPNTYNQSEIPDQIGKALDRINEHQKVLPGANLPISHFVRQLLEADPEKRLSAVEALERFDRIFQHQVKVVVLRAPVSTQNFFCQKNLTRLPWNLAIDGSRFYLFEKVVKKGGSSKIWHGYEWIMKKPVWIKRSVIDPQKKMNHSILAWQLEQGERSPSIAYPESRCYHGNKTYAIYALRPLGDLQSYIAHAGSLPPSSVFACGKQIVEALQHLHQLGVCHHDVSLENLLVNDGKDEMHLQLTNFDRACLIKDSEAMNGLQGSLSYCAPEMVQNMLLSTLNKKPLTEKIDVWACGVVLYYLFNDYQFPSWHRTMEEASFEQNIDKRRILYQKALDKMKNWNRVRDRIKTTCTLSEGCDAPSAAQNSSGIGALTIPSSFCTASEASRSSESVQFISIRSLIPRTGVMKELIRPMLEFHPDRRISAEEALQRYREFLSFHR